ncbi:hypothetical protein C1H46_035080 [Malus baccata]|uniref:RRM domain-containing protein n=1 Tax=Malus baccata TaxID=106549 RepID=A0A540KYT8_MALBA|nr:hypothetical protein C1H46_035080 [Malus baccata]
MSGRFSRTIYVGNLPSDIKEWEVEDLFYKFLMHMKVHSVTSMLNVLNNTLLNVYYGRVVDIELKIPPRPPCYSFVEFESSRDAEDAIRGRDGYNFDGCRLRIELAHGGRGPSSSDRRSGYDRGSGGGRFGVSRHSEYRVIVQNLPSSASWQDLKDHMRRAGDVCFAEVSRDSEGTYGLVDYTNSDDMKYAIRKLDDTEFKNPWARTHIRVKYYDRSPSRSRSRSCSRSRSVRRNRRYWSCPTSRWSDLYQNRYQDQYQDLGLHLLLNLPGQDQDQYQGQGQNHLVRRGRVVPDSLASHLHGFLGVGCEDLLCPTC